MDQNIAATIEIEYLRRLYARATDLIGTGEAAAVSEGDAIYQQIFTQDVDIKTLGGSVPFEATGPAAWRDVVADALANYVATQHLIGTQLVEFEALEVGDDGVVVAGKASMTSYLQAWHEHQDGHVWVFIGTYEDELVFNPGQGWQIAAMILREVSSERRELGTLENPDAG